MDFLFFATPVNHFPTAHDQVYDWLVQFRVWQVSVWVGQSLFIVAEMDIEVWAFGERRIDSFPGYGRDFNNFLPIFKELTIQIFSKGKSAINQGNIVEIWGDEASFFSGYLHKTSSLGILVQPSSNTRISLFPINNCQNLISNLNLIHSLKHLFIILQGKNLSFCWETTSRFNNTSILFPSCAHTVFRLLSAGRNRCDVKGGAMAQADANSDKQECLDS